MTKQYCCLEHVELCMEKMIDAFEQAPQFFLVEEESTAHPTCGYCQNPARYIVANNCSDTKTG